MYEQPWGIGNPASPKNVSSFVSTFKIFSAQTMVQCLDQCCLILWNHELNFGYVIEETLLYLHTKF